MVEDGYRLWLRYDKVSKPELLSDYRTGVAGIIIQQSCPVLNAVQEELQNQVKALESFNYDIILMDIRILQAARFGECKIRIDILLCCTFLFLKLFPDGKHLLTAVNLVDSVNHIISAPQG